MLPSEEPWNVTCHVPASVESRRTSCSTSTFQLYKIGCPAIQCFEQFAQNKSYLESNVRKVLSNYHCSHGRCQPSCAWTKRRLSHDIDGIKPARESTLTFGTSLWTPDATQSRPVAYFLCSSVFTACSGKHYPVRKFCSMSAR